MKKFIALASCLLLLSGCARNFESDLPNKVNDLLKKESTMATALGANRTKEYYKYYLPLDIGTSESTQLGEAFIKFDSTILMNFDPSAIIIYEYYNGQEEEETETQKEQRRQAREDGKTSLESESSTETPSEEIPKIDTETSATTTLTDENLTNVSMQTTNDKFTYQGTYKNIQGNYYPYTLLLISLGNEYVMYLDTSIAQFYCISPLASVESDIQSMFIIAKSISFDTEKVLENFSMKKATSSKQQSIDTLQQNLPSVGSIPDLINQMEQLNGK